MIERDNVIMSRIVLHTLFWRSGFICICGSPLFKPSLDRHSVERILKVSVRGLPLWSCTHMVAI